MTIILGGGIGGLSAAFYLTKKCATTKNIRIFESAERFGGWIKTCTSTKDKNVRFETGPRTLRPIGPRGINTLALCSELGLDKQIVAIPRSHPAAKNRMIAVNGKLHSLPSSILSLFKVLPPFEKSIFSAIKDDYFNPYRGSKLEDDTMYNFVSRRLGDDIAKYLISPMICGICAGDAKEISVKFLLEKFFEYEQNYGSISQGMLKNMFSGNKEIPKDPKCALAEQAIVEKWSIYSMKNGLETLPNKLQDFLKTKDVQTYSNSKCDEITTDSKKIIVKINGNEHITERLISSLPAFALADLIQKQHPILAEELTAIPYVDVAVVNLHFSGNLLPSPGFGFLVPPSENRPILGVIYDSSCFDMGSNTVLTVMMGGKWFPEKFGANGTVEHILNTAIKEVQGILKIKQNPTDQKVNILRKCIPQYIVGHYKRIRRIHDYISDKKLPFGICGSAIDGVGVNDVIYSAKNAVDKLT